ncbi:MAG TPA: hypothetical protein VHE35_12470 [Kofleriaceae bacterium]|nr:hypothetical protein [Kofleriaceae bacterium]
MSLRDRARSLRARLRRPAAAVMAAACALVAVLYLANHDMGGDSHSPRGDGHYRPVLARGDGHMMYLMARSIVFDGDLDFANDLQRFGDPWGQPRTKTGRKGIPHPIGPPLVWAPVLALAQGGAVVANVFGAGIQTHGYTLWHQRIVFFTSVLFGCGAVLLGRRLAARLYGGAWAPTYAGVAVLLGSPLTYYATVMPSYGHALDAFTCAAFLGYWAATAGRDDVRRYLLLGALLGLAMLVRVQELGLGVVVAVEQVARAAGALRDRTQPAVAARVRKAALLVARGAIVLAAAFVCFVPQLVAWKIVYGQYHLPQGDAYTRWTTPMIAEVLWSARNGWFSLTPVAYLACIGLCLVPRRHRLVGAGLIAAVVVQVYLNSVIMDWWGQASFGQRRLCSMTLPLVVGLAALLAACGRLLARVRALASRARVRIIAGHAVALAVLAPMLAWNVWRVQQLRGGKPAPTLLSPTCCNRVPPPLRGLARRVYDTVGNPFELPASAVFAWRHGTSLARWDQAVGDYPIILDGGLMMTGGWRTQHGTWNLAGGGGAPYLLEGFGPTQQGDRAFRWTTAGRARAIVPNLIPEGERYTVWLAPGGAHHVRVAYAGRVVADVDLAPGWNAVSFELRDPPTGSNELVLDSTVGPALDGPLPRPPLGLAGVAVGVVDVSFLPAP